MACNLPAAPEGWLYMSLQAGVGSRRSSPEAQADVEPNATALQMSCHCWNYRILQMSLLRLEVWHQVAGLCPSFSLPATQRLRLSRRHVASRVQPHVVTRVSEGPGRTGIVKLRHLN